MTVFISYSHRDKEFVDRLALELVRARAPIWLDRWELKVGDSLLQRVQRAIDQSAALVVVLSRSSVESEWCKKELTAGLMKELEEKEVVVLPVVIDDCPVPLFLRDKLYADFRGNFDEGKKQLLAALARFMSDTRARIKGPDADVDWSMDVTPGDDELLITLTMVQHGPKTPYTVLFQSKIVGNKTILGRFLRYAEHGLDWLYRQVIVEMLRDAASRNDLRMHIVDPNAAIRQFGINDDRTDMKLMVSMEARALGNDTGFDLIVDPMHDYAAVLESMRLHTRPPTPEELALMARLAKEVKR
jgi:hypothetical protein